MNDLVTFLRDRLAEDEQAALAASWDEWDGSHWTARHREQRDGRWVIIDRADEGVTDVTPQAADDGAVARHIARQDPARVLREVEAKRRIMDWHIGQRNDKTPWGEPVVICFCGYDLPCATLRLLALPYTDHPDYRDAWRP
ncbi:DUF6221 family protein [Streptomyces sp. NPDC057557]|uniref:DUF6221 family protein n=1 Tax=Streptomyces sp. NPDC057557 TaxID=3346167 RepID=UPI0036776CD1